MATSNAQTAESYKDEGNVLFKKKEYGRATDAYSKGIATLEQVESLSDNSKDLLTTLLNNRALCQLNVGLHVMPKYLNFIRLKTFVTVRKTALAF